MSGCPNLSSQIENMTKRIYIDVDGVLTDGKLTIDHKGEKLFKSFHTRDVRAIRELVSVHGCEVCLVTADTWPGIASFAEKTGADVQFCRDKRDVTVQGGWAVGDDAWDAKMLANADRAFCPADADASVKQIEGIHVLETKGGQGVVAELLRIFANRNNTRIMI
jgi:3-deoxy-D-manno-octulosonate 8-phosphate phosphatase (KDO 8-P phosphatase)